MFFLLFLH